MDETIIKRFHAALREHGFKIGAPSSGIWAKTVEADNKVLQRYAATAQCSTMIRATPQLMEAMENKAKLDKWVRDGWPDATPQPTTSTGE